MKVKKNTEMTAVESSDASRKLARFLIYFAFLDTLACSIILTSMMPRIKFLATCPILAGFVAAIYGGVQLVSSPIAGNYGDKYDRKTLLMVSILISAVSYYMMGFPCLPTFIVMRILLGLFKHTQLFSQAYMSDLVPASETGTYFGYYGASIGLGFIFGPALSGHITQWQNDYSVLTTTTSLIFVANAVLVWTFLPKQSSAKPELQKNSTQQQQQKKKSEKSYLKKLGLDYTWDLLTLEFFSEVAFATFVTNLVEILLTDYGLSHVEVGYLLSGTSVVGIVALLSGKLSASLGYTLIAICMAAQFTALLVLSQLPSYNNLALALLVLFASIALLKSSWANLLIARSTPDKSGSMVGLSNGVVAVATMLGSIAAGIASQVTGSANSATVLSAAIAALGLLGNLWLPKKSAKIKSS